ncbi:unnamed protein product [Strongylus vulgaris]|uniref:Nematode cuticle collagen N-terminal domain-containing protein n=1 Tax=Strongylus vulgaris TaxID=40348 RepID=A0A3P7IS97_STRVU|nr:unnamed protein product [Strongylus vulgaris]
MFPTMFEVKLVMRVASAGSTLAIVACLKVVPLRYDTINENYDDILDGLSAIRDDIDFT